MRADLKKAAVATIAGVLVLGSLGAASPAAAGGYRGHGYWGHRHHSGWGAPLAAGVLGALAVGAAIGAAQQPYYGYGSCYPADQPVLDAWGNVVAYRRVQVCD
jgi:hypothetical protein